MTTLPSALSVISSYFQRNCDRVGLYPCLVDFVDTFVYILKNRLTFVVPDLRVYLSLTLYHQSDETTKLAILCV